MFLSLCCKKLEKLLYGLVWTDMLSSAEYDQFIIAKLSVNHRPGSHIWSGNQSCEPCQPCLLNYSNNADIIQDWVSVCCAQCPFFFLIFLLLMHQPLFTGPAGVVCPDSRWLYRLLLPLASQMQLFGWPTDWFHCRLSLWLGLGHSFCALCAYWFFTTEQRTQPRLGKGMMRERCLAQLGVD